jgi:glycosyltransferase involved in cell wall biosynthesis
VKSSSLHFIIKDDLEQRTGGYIYDDHIIRGLRELGWVISVHSTSLSSSKIGTPPNNSLENILNSIEEGQTVILDGLVMGRNPRELSRHTHRLKLISLLHHPLFKESGLPQSEMVRLFEMEKKALTNCVGVITTSQFTANQLATMNIPTEIIRTVIPGTKPALPAKGPHKNAPPRLLCVASVIPRKGFHILIDALHKIRCLDWECICAGSLDRSPSYASEILETVAKHQLGHRILFTGECSSATIDKLYDFSSIFVLASLYEGYGMVLAEAATRSLPIISTTGGAIPYTMKGTPAILVPAGDSNSLADALRNTLNNLADESYSVQNQFPNWEQATRNFEDAITSLVPDTAFS